jgi:5-methyltetrahydropteroyltriglutamate--homocysteine methyltransferase
MGTEPRAETVGSLLRPESLRVVRHRFNAGQASAEEMRRAEDAAVLDAIKLQEAAGLDVISDGEMRRRG